MTKEDLIFMIGIYLTFFIGYWLGKKQEDERSWVTAHKDVENQLEEKDNKIAELEAQVEKMRNCANCKYYQPVNDAEYFTCIKDGKHNGENYRSCEFNLEKWQGR